MDLKIELEYLEYKWATFYDDIFTGSEFIQVKPRGVAGINFL